MRKKVPIALACATLIAILVAPVESLASRKQLPPTPEPSQVLIQEPSEPAIDLSQLALALFAMSALLGYWVFSLRENLSTLSDESARQIKSLEKELCDSKAISSDYAAKASQLKEKLFREQERLSKKEMELSKVCEKLANFKSRIATMIQADPEIEKKVAILLESQARAEAEKKARKDAEAAQRKLKFEGKAQIQELLTEMKRGY